VSYLAGVADLKTIPWIRAVCLGPRENRRRRAPCRNRLTRSEMEEAGRHA
jgi:hypothetical protein